MHSSAFDLFSSPLAVTSMGVYILFIICYSVTLSGFQRFAFPVLNASNTANTVFVLLTLLWISPFFSIDSMISESCDFYTQVICITLLCSVGCFQYFSREFVKAKNFFNYEYDLLINFSILGLLVICYCNDFLTFYIAIELQSLCFYVLATFNKSSEFCAEAGLKYFVLGAFSSGLLLFGFTILYATLGSLSFDTIARIDSSIHFLITLSGCIFFLSAMLFKMGAFPFHMWLCDIYDGTTINVTAFFAAVPKVVLLSFILRNTFLVFESNHTFLENLFSFAGLGSICFASVAALYQKRIKRLMAYSTISHTGFLLLGICCGTIDSIKACLLYITIYIMMTLCTFTLLFLSGFKNSQQKYIVNWTSLFERNFGFAIALTLLLYSMAGIPPLSGFYSKLSVLLCIIAQNYIGISVVVAFFSSVACFYYIRLVKVLFFTSATKAFTWFGAGSKSMEFFISLCLSIVVFFLISPNMVLNYCSIAALSLI